MSFLPVRRIAQTAAVVALAAGGVAFAQADKSVNLSVDGKTSAVHLIGSTVGDVLASQKITIGPHDVVAPAVSAPIRDDQKVVVRYGRLLTVTVDGQTQELWTTSTTVSGALTELGIRADTAKLSVSRSQSLGRTGLALSVTTPKNVTVTVDGKTRNAQTTGATVADMLSGLKVRLGAKDRVVPALKTPVANGVKVAVARVTQRNVTATESIGFKSHRQNDTGIYIGQSKTRTAGIQGSKVVTYLDTRVNGKLESHKSTSSRVTKAPVTQILAIGTKARPVARPVARAISAPAPSRSSAGGSTANAGMWDRIAQCESGGNWAINTGNGYYGGLQFDRGTWLSNGGGSFGATANLASRTQQIAVANKVYAARGLQPWGCAHAA